MTDPGEPGDRPAEPGEHREVPGKRPDEPGERPPRRLERAPGTRYVAPQTTQPSAPRPIGRGRAATSVLLVVVAGAVLLAILGSFNLDAGLLAITAGIGWAVGLAVAWTAGRVALRGTEARRLRRGRLATLGAGLGAGSSIGGLVLLWAWSRVEGGVLDPVAYSDARFGLLAAAFVLVAAAVAAIRAARG